MEISRRHFFKISGAMAAASLVNTDPTARAATAPATSEDEYGCLVDTTLCVGCRKCEAGLQPTARPSPAKGILRGDDGA